MKVYNRLVLKFLLADKPSIVVLPFVNISGDPEQEYFSDGMTEEMINLKARKAVELDPLSGTAHFCLGFSLNASGQFDQALRELRRAREMMPTHLPSFIWLVLAYIRKKMFEEAMEEINEGLRIFPLSPILVCQKGSIYALKGEKEKAQEILDEMLERSKEEDVPSSAFSILYADLGEIDKLLEYLETGYEKRDLNSVLLKVYLLQFLLSDPRLKDFFKKMEL